MTEGLNPMIAAAVGTNSVVGDASHSDEHLKPTTRQYQIVAGDYVVLAASESLIEKAFMCGEVLDPSDYQQQFPDWIERIQKGYMLLRWKSHMDLAGDLGWFSRAKMLPMTKEQYDQIVAWLESGQNDNHRPDFLVAEYEKYHDELNELSPDQVGRSATCGQCQSRNVYILFSHQVYVKVDASEIQKDDTTKFVPTGHHEIRCEAHAVLWCGDCEAKRLLSKDELTFERGSIIGQVVDHPH